MLRLPAALAAAAMLCAAAVRGSGDTIRSKDGQTFRGRVVSEMEGVVTIRTKFGELTVPKPDLKEHHRDTYVIELKNGTKVEAQIVGETGNGVTIKEGEETRTLAADEIENTTIKKPPPKPKKPPKPDVRKLMKMHNDAMGLLKKKDYDKSIEAYKKILASEPEDRIALYNVACAYALKGDKPNALEFLKKSVEAGFVDYGHMEKDPDLDSLREEEIYKELFTNREKYILQAAEKAVGQITEALKKRKIDVSAYKTVYDNERNLVYVHAKTDEEIAVLREGLEKYAEHQWKYMFEHKPEQPIYIVLLRAEDSQKVLGRRVGGFFNRASNALFCGDMPAYRLLRASVIIHEFTHALHWADQAARKQQHPIWISEGLATLFETAKWVGDRWMPQHSYRLGIVQRAIKLNRWTPWADIMKMNQLQFMMQAQVNYAQARYMLFFMHEKGYLKRFYDEYTNATGYEGDKTASESYEVIFGKPLSAVERDWKAWILEQEVPSVPYLGIRSEAKGGKLVVQQAMKDTPAEKAGLKKGDVVAALDGATVRNVSDLMEALGGRKVGDEVLVTVERGGKTEELTVTLGERPSGERPIHVPSYLGLTVEQDGEQVKVKEVEKGSPAEAEGIEAGMVLLEFQGKMVLTVRDYLKAFRETKPKQIVTLKLMKPEELAETAKEYRITLGEVPATAPVVPTE